MRHWLTVFIAAFLNLTLAPVIVSRAQTLPSPEGQQCIPPQQLFAGLESIGEAPAIVGVGPRGTTGILARNPDTTSWTFVLITQEGCLAFSIGGDHSATVEKKPGRPS